MANDESPLGKAQEKGYIGTVPDMAPNEDYAVDGAITSGEKPDPAYEKMATDAAAAEANLPSAPSTPEDGNMDSGDKPKKGK